MKFNLHHQRISSECARVQYNRKYATLSAFSGTRQQHSEVSSSWSSHIGHKAKAFLFCFGGIQKNTPRDHRMEGGLEDDDVDGNPGGSPEEEYFTTHSGSSPSTSPLFPWFGKRILFGSTFSEYGMLLYSGAFLLAARGSFASRRQAFSLRAPASSGARLSFTSASVCTDMVVRCQTEANRIQIARQ